MNAFTILKRDLKSHFTSPIGYIYLIVFLFVSVGLMFTTLGFFVSPRADMQRFFGFLPIMLSVFIPAITMRVWAEEKKENTFEMLLTFPLKTSQLIMGKFLATFTFYLISLAFTFTIPLMLSVLGSPDWGVITTGYIGAILLGAFLIAIGVFISGLCKDQVVSFVLALLICFSLYYVSLGGTATQINEYVPHLGTWLSTLFGFMGHYEAFGRGIVELSDIVFFAIWIGLFLYLNAFHIDSRNRPHGGWATLTFGAICVAIGFAVNAIVVDASLARFDCTEGKIYTVSDASKRVLNKLDVPLQVRYYVSTKSKMPTQMRDMEKEITAKLRELALASDNKVDFQVIHMEASELLSLGEEKADNAQDKEKSLEERLIQKGIQPFQVAVQEEDQVSTRLIYSSIGIAYKNKKEVVIPQITPQTLFTFEYNFINTIYKLTREKQPVVALLAPVESISEQMKQIYRQMGRPVPPSDDPYIYLEQLLAHEKYLTRRITLTKEQPLPADYDTLVVINPKQLNERQQWEISRALHSGKSVFMAVQQTRWDYQIQGNQMSVGKSDINPNANPILEPLGLSVNKDILMDSSSQPLTIGNAMSGLLGGGTPINHPMQVFVRPPSMNQELSITSNLGELFYLWGTALKMDMAKLKENKLTSTVLFTSSHDAWQRTIDKRLTQEDLTKPLDTKEFPLAAMFKGQFPAGLSANKRPAWPQSPPAFGQAPQPQATDEEPPAPAVTAKAGKLILMGGTQMFRKDFFGPSSQDLFLNVVDALTLGDDLVQIRGKKPKSRLIDKPSDGQRFFWKFTNLILINLIIAIFGIVYCMMRRKSRELYTKANA